MDCPKCNTKLRATRTVELDLVHVTGSGSTAKVVSMEHTIRCDACGFAAAAETLHDAIEKVTAS